MGLTLLPEENWNNIRQETLSQNRLIHTMYHSIGDMCLVGKLGG
jgi:hypothetical protein